MKWRRMEFHQRRPDAREVFAQKRTTPFAINPSCKRPAKICSPSSTRTEIASHTISADFTTWRLISADSHGPSSQNAHGHKSEPQVRGRSLPNHTQQPSPPEHTLAAAHIPN